MLSVERPRCLSSIYFFPDMHECLVSYPTPTASRRARRISPPVNYYQPRFAPLWPISPRVTVVPCTPPTTSYIYFPLYLYLYLYPRLPTLEIHSPPSNDPKFRCSPARHNHNLPTFSTFTDTHFSALADGRPRCARPRAPRRPYAFPTTQPLLTLPTTSHPVWRPFWQSHSFATLPSPTETGRHARDISARIYNCGLSGTLHVCLVTPEDKPTLLRTMPT